MPKEFVKCVAALKREGKAEDSAYAICTESYKKRHGGRTPQEDHVKTSLEVTVDSIEGVESVEVKQIDEKKGVSAIIAGEKIIQYRFDLLNEAEWTPETAIEYIKASLQKPVYSILSGTIIKDLKVEQSEAIAAKLKGIDDSPFFVPLKINYGIGSNKQHFDKAFFEKAGPKFMGTPFLFNHSDLTEFGKGIPVGSIVEFAGAKEDGAEFIAYVSAAEGTLRQKIRESQALGDLGYVRKISIEGIPSENDFTEDKKTNIKYFRDLKRPTGIAIVNAEGLKGSSIKS